MLLEINLETLLKKKKNHLDGLKLKASICVWEKVSGWIWLSLKWYKMWKSRFYKV